MSQCHRGSFVERKWMCWIELMHFETRQSDYYTFNSFQYDGNVSLSDLIHLTYIGIPVLC